MIRDEELSRLIKYAEGMGVKVKISNTKYNTTEAAAWTLDGSEITIYKKNNTSKTDILLSMIHELGHHVWFIHERNRTPDLKFEEAITRQEMFEDNIKNNPAPKKLREKILNTEKAGTDYWHTIYKDTNMKFPLWKLYAQIELDIWHYEVFYKTGHFPTRKTSNGKKREIVAKHKKRIYE